MVALVVFYLHVLAFTAVFTSRWQEEGTKEGVLGVIFMLLIFFVGWSMASFVIRTVMPPEGLGKAFDNDATALTLLTLAEAVFYYFYFRKDSHEPEDSATSA